MDPCFHMCSDAPIYRRATDAAAGMKHRRVKGQGLPGSGDLSIPSPEGVSWNPSCKINDLIQLPHL